MNAQIRAAWLVAVSIMVLACGCSGSETPDDTTSPPVSGSPGELTPFTPTSTSSPAALRVRDIGDRGVPGWMVLPLHSYVLTTDERTVMQRAFSRLVVECMADKGFDWPGFQPEYVEMVNMYRRYGSVYDKSLAAEYGYHYIEVNDPDRGAKEPTGDERFALLGDEIDGSPGGCYDTADAQLVDGFKYHRIPRDVPDLVQQVSHESFNRSEEDERVVAAFGAWSDCMAERGYDFTDPMDPAKYESLNINSVRPSAAEVEQAVWDVECQERTGVTRTWFEVEVEIQQQLIDQHAEAFAQIKAETEELFKRASAIVEDQD